MCLFPFQVYLGVFRNLPVQGRPVCPFLSLFGRLKLGGRELQKIPGESMCSTTTHFQQPHHRDAVLCTLRRFAMLPKNSCSGHATNTGNRGFLDDLKGILVFARSGGNDLLRCHHTRYPSVLMLLEHFQPVRSQSSRFSLFKRSLCSVHVYNQLYLFRMWPSRPRRRV